MVALKTRSAGRVAARAGAKSLSKSVRKTITSSRPAAQYSVCDGQEAIGDVLGGGKRWRARLADGRALGIFANHREAMRAVCLAAGGAS